MTDDQKKDFDKKIKIRNVCFILLGIVVLIFKSNYSGPFVVFVHSYAGNVAVSFSVYFLACLVPVNNKRKRFLTTVMALAAVEFFEIFDGFGVMSNVYDTWDIIANVAGVALGFFLDSVLASHQRTGKNVRTITI